MVHSRAVGRSSRDDLLECLRLLGATGFDVGRETPGACRGAGLLV